MFNKLVTAIEPFGLTAIILCGMTVAGWIQFSNDDIVGIVTVFFGSLLVVNHIAKQIAKPKKVKKG